MVPFNRRQRLVLIALGLANLIALSTLGFILLQPPSISHQAIPDSPLDPRHLQACSKATGQALFDAGLSGLVQTGHDGTILIQVQRTPVSNDPRLDADAATWSALESVASQPDCRVLNTVRVTVVLASGVDGPNHTGKNELHATAHVGMADLLLWALGEIDDAELTLRLEYQSPAPHPPAYPTTPSIP